MQQFLLLPLLFLSFFVHASSLRGNVTDKLNGEPLVGATVYLKNTSYGTSVGLDGSFLLKGVAAGSYQLIVSMVGYRSIERPISIADDKDQRFSFVMEEDAAQLSEVVVKGVLDNESDLSARKAEQKADNVLNMMSAKSIQLLPDLTVGNLLQRVSGVSIVRNSSGDGQYAIIRGMDKRYNYVLVNGIKIPSPDNKNRYVPLDIFPADIIERLEVIKNLTPNMEGDAIGGAMNIVTKNPPPTLTIAGTLAGGVSNIFSDSRPFSGFNTSNIPTKSPVELHGSNYGASPSDFGVNQLQYNNNSRPINSLMSFSIGNRVLNNKLGFILAASYQNIYRGTNSIFFNPSEPSPLPDPNTYQFSEIQIRQFSNLQKRLGIHAKLDYSFNNKNKLTFYNLFVQLDEAQHRNYHNPFSSGLITYDVHDRSRFTTQKIYNTSLRGDHALTQKLKLDWTVAYSMATSNTPAWSDMNVRYRYDNTGTLVSTVLLPVSQQWTNNSDKDYTSYVNLNYSLKPNLDIAVGGMARFKTRDNFRAYYELNTIIPGSNTADYEAYTSIDKAVFNFLPQQYYYASTTDPNNYTAKENISAVYVQGKYSIGKLQVIGGVRNENTLQEYQSQLTIYQAGRNGSISYSDLLPSLNFKYALTEKQNLRLSYYKAISRPNYFEFVPVILPGDNWDEEGNYQVKHATADNYDLRYEFFNKGNDQILAGLFYKKITDPIEFGLDPKGVSSYAVKPYNYGVATNYGFEFVISKYIKNFGITANYTYTNSSITTNKLLIHQTPTGSQKDIVSQTRPLQGQSNNIGNVSFIYKNSNLGFDAQISMVYTGRRINFVSPFKDLDYWQRDFTQVDFSAEKKIFKKFQLFVKVTNLLNTPLIVEVINPNPFGADGIAQDSSDRIVVQKDQFYQTFLTGLRFKM